MNLPSAPLGREIIYKTSITIHQKLVITKALLTLQATTTPPFLSAGIVPLPPLQVPANPSPVLSLSPLPAKPTLCSWLPSHRACSSHLHREGGDPGLGCHTVSPPATPLSWSSPPHTGSLPEGLCMFLLIPWPQRMLWWVCCLCRTGGRCSGAR